MDNIGLIVLLWIVIFGAVGAAIGKRKGREVAGFFLGAVIGPLGWLLVAVGPSVGPKCPECKGALESGVRRCRHCGAQLSDEAIKAALWG